jgi:hypothetical protein
MFVPDCIMSNRKGKMDVRFKSGIIVFIIVILLASSTIGILFNGKSKSSAMDAVYSDNKTELYAYFSSGNDSSRNMSIALSNGDVFNYTTPGATIDCPLNGTIDVGIMIVNHENKKMDYNLFVYQSIPDAFNNTFNITYLYTSPVDTMFDNEARRFALPVKPAYASNNSMIGIAVYEGTLDNCSRIITYTDVNANIF